MASLALCMHASCCQVHSNAPVHATCMQLCLMPAPLLMGSLFIYMTLLCCSPGALMPLLEC